MSDIQLQRTSDRIVAGIELARSLLRRLTMRSRLPSWILLLYLAIDLANPFIPGAFRFTPEEGAVWVEGAPHSREELRAAPVERG